jgi:hypothetical protein
MRACTSAIEELTCSGAVSTRRFYIGDLTEDAFYQYLTLPGRLETVSPPLIFPASFALRSFSSTFFLPVLGFFDDLSMVCLLFISVLYRTGPIFQDINMCRVVLTLHRAALSGQRRFLGPVRI